MEHFTVSTNVLQTKKIAEDKHSSLICQSVSEKKKDTTDTLCIPVNSRCCCSASISTTRNSLREGTTFQLLALVLCQA